MLLAVRGIAADFSDNDQPNLGELSTLAQMSYSKGVKPGWFAGLALRYK